jgi:hypothetical protein
MRKIISPACESCLRRCKRSCVAFLARSGPAPLSVCHPWKYPTDQEDGEVAARSTATIPRSDSPNFRRASEFSENRFNKLSNHVANASSSHQAAALALTSATLQSVWASRICQRKCSIFNLDQHRWRLHFNRLLGFLARGCEPGHPDLTV